MEKEQGIFTKQRIRVVVRIILIIAVVFIIGLAGFTVFRIQTQAKIALREAKNVRLSLEMLDIELYAERRSIYAPKEKGGMAAGVEDKIRELQSVDGSFAITGYDAEGRTVTGMTYETDHYLVIYSRTESGEDHWRVMYFLTVGDYDR